MSDKPTLDRFHRRIDALRVLLRADGDSAQALLVASTTNITYLTGFSGDSSRLLVTPDRAILISDGRYTEQIERECPGLEVSIRAVGKTLVEGIAEVVTKLAIPKAAFESAHLTVSEHLNLKEKTPGTHWEGATLFVERLRLVKDSIEIEAIREAVRIAESAFGAWLRDLPAALDLTEKALADSLEFALRRAGATRASFPPIIAAGPNAALPHGRPTFDTRLRDHDFTLVDWGACGGLYLSDLTRMVLHDKPRERFESVYQAVLLAQERAIAAVRPGVNSKSIDTVARQTLEELGFGAQFTHSLGHGIGLDVHELPTLGREPAFDLQPGMIFTIEPGVYLPGWGGVRIEDDVLVTDEGAQVLSTLPKSLESVQRRG